MKINVSRFRFAVFDIHGTLVDSKHCYRVVLRMFTKLMTRLGLLGDNKLYLPSGGFPLPVFVQRLLRFRPLELLALKLEKIALKLSVSLDTPPRLFDGVTRTLAKFCEKGIKLFASTGCDTQTTRDSLQRLGIDQFFTLIIGSDEAPKKEHIPLFANHLGLSFKLFTRHAVFVSDGPVDLSLAKESGVYGIGIPNTLPPKLLLKAGAMMVISDLRQLSLQ